jgi:hypothetical protein
MEQHAATQDAGAVLSILVMVRPLTYVDSKKSLPKYWEALY